MYDKKRGCQYLTTPCAEIASSRPCCAMFAGFHPHKSYRYLHTLQMYEMYSNKKSLIDIIYRAFNIIYHTSDYTIETALGFDWLEPSFNLGE